MSISLSCFLLHPLFTLSLLLYISLDFFLSILTSLSFSLPLSFSDPHCLISLSFYISLSLLFSSLFLVSYLSLSLSLSVSLFKFISCFLYTFLLSLFLSFCLFCFSFKSLSATSSGKYQPVREEWWEVKCKAQSSISKQKMPIEKNLVMAWTKIDNFTSIYVLKRLSKTLIFLEINQMRNQGIKKKVTVCFKVLFSAS